MEAVAATVVMLLILAGIKPIEARFQQHHRQHELVVETEPGALSLAALETVLGYRARRIVRYVAQPSETPGLEDVSITLTRLSHKDVEEIEQELGRLSGVTSVARLGA